jgi:hypothetical protein
MSSPLAPSSPIHDLVSVASRDLHHLFVAIEREQHDTASGAEVPQSSVTYGVLPASRLLQEPLIAHALKQIKEMSLLPESEFKQHYMGLLERYALWVQGAVSHDGAVIGSLFKEGIIHALLVMRVFCEAHRAPVDTRLLFTLFSATLLQNIAALMTQQCVFLCDEDGRPEGRWNPLSGSLFEKAARYCVVPYVCPRTLFSAEHTALLAHTVMPDPSLEWISDDEQNFELWLTALMDKPMDAWETRKPLIHILDIIKKPLRHFIGLADKLKPIKVSHKENKYARRLTEFLLYIRHKIFDESLSINLADSSVFLTESGVFLRFPYLFEEFIGRYARSHDYVVLVAMCNALGITKMSGEDHKYDQYFQGLPSELLEHLSFIHVHDQVMPGVMVVIPELVLSPAAYVQHEKLDAPSRSWLPQNTLFQHKPH